MLFSDCLNLYGEEEACFFAPYLRVEESFDQLDLPVWQDVPNLPSRDSMIYISQFLDIIDLQLPLSSKSQAEDAPVQDNSSARRIFQKTQNVSAKKGKKIKKLALSPFHNYQKHLNNALKKIVIIPCFEGNEQLYKKAAQQIWNKYVETEIKTKKILHAVFNERNEYSMNEGELRLYGLWDIFTLYGENTFNCAKIYLSKLAIDQIDHQNIEGYLQTRKMKKIEGFKEYILQFRQELCNGYLKRRITAQQPSN